MPECGDVVRFCAPQICVTCPGEMERWGRGVADHLGELSSKSIQYAWLPQHVLCKRKTFT